MPTQKPRLNVTFEPDDYAVIRDLAVLNEQSMSRVVADAMHDLVPMLANVVRAGRVFQAAQQGVRADIRDAFGYADEVVGPEIARLQADILSRLEDIASIAEKPEDPRRVIRGSDTPTPHLLPVPKPGGRDS